MRPLALSLRLLAAQPDERLLTLAIEGHGPAFEALVRRYRRPLLAYCRRIAPQLSAEDLLQQALLQAWGALAGGAQVRDARAWLYRITHNVAVSATRERLNAVEKLGEVVSNVGIEHLVEQRIAAREALAHLAALPPLQREVMLGTALEGRSHEEMATELGLTGGSVRGLLYRARATLRAAAAALIPSPLIEWVAGHQPTGRGGARGAYEMVAGGSSAGMASILVKTGAVVTVAGFIAGTTAVVTSHPLRHGRAAWSVVLERPVAGHRSSIAGRVHRSFAASTPAALLPRAAVTGAVATPEPAAASPASAGRSRTTPTSHGGSSGRTDSRPRKGAVHSSPSYTSTTGGTGGSTGGTGNTTSITSGPSAGSGSSTVVSEPVATSPSSSDAVDMNASTPDSSASGTSATSSPDQSGSSTPSSDS